MCSHRCDGVGEAGRVLARRVGDHAEQDGAAAGRRAGRPAHRALAHRHAAAQGRGAQHRSAAALTITYLYYDNIHRQKAVYLLLFAS